MFESVLDTPLYSKPIKNIKDEEINAIMRLVSLLLTLNIFSSLICVFIVNFEHVFPCTISEI